MSRPLPLEKTWCLISSVRARQHRWTRDKRIRVDGYEFYLTCVSIIQTSSFLNPLIFNLDLSSYLIGIFRITRNLSNSLSKITRTKKKKRRKEELSKNSQRNSVILRQECQVLRLKRKKVSGIPLVSGKVKDLARAFAKRLVPCQRGRESRHRLGSRVGGIDLNAYCHAPPHTSTEYVCTHH